MVEAPLTLKPGSTEQAGLERLLGKARGYLPSEKLALLEETFNFALQCHQGQKRESGEPYWEHPLAVALTLADLQMDTFSLAAALLHDVIEDCGVSLAELEKRFGAEVVRLVDGCTKLSQLSRPLPPGEGGAQGVQAENLRKMLLAMAEDLRVVFIKLADRLHNMITLQALPLEKRHSIARETLEIYAPLAHRLGMWEIKSHLEDLAFMHLEPHKYSQVSSQVTSHRPLWEDLIEKVGRILRQELKKAGTEAEVTGRAKNLYSIYQKTARYEDRGKSFEDIHDLMALRVVVNTLPDCYSALGVIHSLWHPLPGEFDDYIASPKSNGYQSLHTAVMCLGTTPLEIQVRTREMHHLAEYGVASHWRYKEGEKRDVRFEDRIAWLRQLMEWHREFSQAEEFVESVKTDIFQDQVYVYTPKGEIKELPAGSTPLDFAYQIHTDLGHRCIGAKVNGRLVPLSRELRNGDTVEILAAKGARGPSRDWLNPDLGYVKSSHTREKIRQWFKRQARGLNVERGRQVLEKELRRLGLAQTSYEDLSRLFRQDTVEDFLAAIGYGEITPRQIAVKLAAQQEQPKPEVAPPARAIPSGIQVQGVGDLLHHLARCCHPLPGDEIIGYITRSRGLTIHRKDCYNVLREDERERLVAVSWGERANLYPATVQVRAWDRVGLLRDISMSVAEEKVNIASVTAQEQEDGTTSISLTLEIRDIVQLSRLLAKIERAPGVNSVRRVGDTAATSQDKD